MMAPPRTQQDFAPLSDLMVRERAPESVIAFTHDRSYDWRGFCACVAGLRDRIGAQREGRWLLACESSYHFGAGLCALWQTGNVAVLPPNLQPGSLEDLSGGLSGGIGDKTAPGGGLPWLDPAAARGEPGGPWRTLDRFAACLELFTSGSTGERKRVSKTIAQLEDELAVHEKTFGERLGDCAVLATVSHQHIYGLLHRLLWPLCAGRPFCAQTLFLWDELLAVLRRRTAGCIISSPVHLERLDQGSDAPPAVAGCRAVFSSGGPLRRSSAERVRDLTGCAPIEIFGSTETGGVAWRQQCGEGASVEWRPLEGVRVRVAGEGASPGQLQVRSPFASATPDAPAQLMGDRCEVGADGRFRVFGRVDRVAKIAEERFSLNEMERRLAGHPWVARAALVILQGAGRPPRDFVGAAVVLQAPARRHLEARGRQAVNSELRAHLRRHFEPVTLPRFFRYVDALPRDSQGKTTALALKNLFHPPYDPAVTRPECLERSRSDAQITLRLRVPADLAYLDGHFPEFPVVPGVVQAKWVWEAATELLGRTPAIKGMEAVKFKELLLPGREFTLRVQRKKSRDGERLCYELADGDATFSAGRYVLGEPPAEGG